MNYYDRKNTTEVVLIKNENGEVEGLITVKRKQKQKQEKQKQLIHHDHEQQQKQQQTHEQQQQQQQSVSCTEWCCDCEKCAFIFLLLSAWLPPKGTENYQKQ